ncbi:MAG: delta-60 repeat domain-containing protein, partial [Gemmataceae bacterium]
MRFFPSRHPSRRPPRRLRLEPLEDRTTPSTGALLDPTFGSGGTVASSLSNNLDTGTAAAVQPNGQIVVVGGTTARNSRTARDFLVARYNPNGTLDTSFGSSGGYTATDFKSNSDLATAIVLLPSGKILAAGYASPSNGHGSYFALVRYTANGALDSTFGSRGKVMTDLGGFADTMAVQPDGKILLAGRTGASGTLVLALARYNPDGAPDATFGSGGKLITTIPTNNMLRAQQVGLQPQPGGTVKIVVAATSGNEQQFVVTRFNLNGTTDATFGVNGQVTINPQPGANNSDVEGLAIQPDGKIVVGGTSYDAVASTVNFVAVRLTANGAADAGFGQAMTGVVVVPNPS